MPNFSEISKDYLALTFCYFLLLLFFSFKKEINMKHHSDIYKQGSLKKSKEKKNREERKNDY